MQLCYDNIGCHGGDADTCAKCQYQHLLSDDTKKYLFGDKASSDEDDDIDK
jgi:hypothetical protein